MIAVKDVHSKIPACLKRAPAAQWFTNRLNHSLGSECVMKIHLNTLYITTQGAYLHKKGDTVCVDIEKQTKLRVPLHNLEGVVGFGNVMFSPFLLGACAETGVSVSMLDPQRAISCGGYWLSIRQCAATP